MALEYIAANSLTVAAAEEYVETLLTRPEPENEEDKPEPRRTLILKDVRIFLNSLNRSLDLMKQGGIDAGVKREETEDSLILTIGMPRMPGRSSSRLWMRTAFIAVRAAQGHIDPFPVRKGRVDQGAGIRLRPHADIEKDALGPRARLRFPAPRQRWHGRRLRGIPMSRPRREP